MPQNPDARTLAERAYALTRRPGSPQRQGDRWRAPCPAHGGDGLNLALWDGEGGSVGACCHSRGCAWRDIMAALGVEDARTDYRGRPNVAAVYETPTGDQAPVYRRDHADGGKTITREAGQPTRGLLVKLWPAPDADGREPVALTEGEKAARAVQEAGFTAASWSGGSNGAPHADYGPLNGRDFVAWPDDDEPGRKAMAAAEMLAQAAGARLIGRITPTRPGETGDDAADLSASERAQRLRDAIRTGYQRLSGATVEVVTPEWAEAAAASAAPYTIDQLLASGSVTVLSAETGVGKSALALDVALHLAAGASDYHGWRITPAPEGRRGRRVLYIDGENAGPERGARVLAHRKASPALAEDLDAALAAGEGVLAFASEPTFRLGESATDPDARPLAERAHGAARAVGVDAWDVIILDTLISLAGIEDPNAQAQAQSIMDELKDATAPCADVLLVCHPSREGGAAIAIELRAGRKPTAALSVSGSMAIVNAAAHISVLASDDEDPARILLSITKTRGAEGTPNIYEIARMKVEDVATDPEGRPRSAVAIAPGPFTKRARDSKIAEFFTWAQGRSEELGRGLTLADCVKDAGCPVARETARAYLTDAKHAAARQAARVTVDPNARQPGERGGRPRLEFWFGDAAPAPTGADLGLAKLPPDADAPRLPGLERRPE